MTVQIITGDCRTILPTLAPQSVQCCVTSPPYFGLRDYGHGGQIGLEATPDQFVSELVGVFREVWRVLRDDGTIWVNLGDSYCSTPKGNPGARGNINGGKRDSVEADAGSAVMNKAKLPGLKIKDLIGIPWMVAFALRADGWYLRQDIIWSKPNPMPESVRDRCTKAHEYIFMLSKSERYFYDQDAVKEPAIYAGLKNQDDSGFKNPQSFNDKHKDGYRSSGTDKQRGHGRRHAGFNDRWGAMSKQEQSFGMRNKRSVWSIATQPFSEAHFATFPPDLIEPCIKAGSQAGDTILDPFGGAGTTGLVADRLGRNAVLCELNPEYAAMSERRITNDSPLFAVTA